MDSESVLDYNFWPSFADLMLAFVFILVLVLFIFTGFLAVGTVDLSSVETNQENMINTVAEAYQTTPVELDEGLFGISTTNDTGNCDIRIRNEPTLQRITFSDHILFPQNYYTLNLKGRQVLRIVGDELKKQLSFIRDIQIQGHADPDPTDKHPSNLHLAAYRALGVFKFLQDSVGIDPAQNLMSATSYGEFKPVQRSQDDSLFNRRKLLYHNITTELKDKNRRIELLLFYRF